MLWQVGALVLGCALGACCSSSKRRHLPAPRSAESPLLPEELAELSELKAQLSSARHKADLARAAAASARAAFDRAVGNLRFAHIFSIVILSLAGTVTLGALVVVPADGRPALVMFVVVGFIVLAMAAAIAHESLRSEVASSGASLAREEQELRDATQATDHCADALSRAQQKSRLAATLRQEQEREAERAKREAESAKAAATQLAAHAAVKEAASRTLALAVAEKQKAVVAPLLKNAFAHWRIAGVNPERFVEVHADRLVENEQKILAAYQDCSLPASTADDCRRLAETALREFPEEVTYWLPDEAHRTVERITYILRWYNGSFREHLLPAAQELIYKRNRSIRPEPVTPVPVDTAPELPEPLQQLVDRLPIGQAMEVQRKLIDALTLADIGAVKREARAVLRRRLEEEGVSEEAIEEELETFAVNLDKIDHRSAIEKGLIPHDPTT